MNRAVVAYDFNPITQEAKAEFEANLVYRAVSEQAVLCREILSKERKGRNEENSMNRTGKRAQMAECLFSMYQARVHPQQGTS